MKANVLIISPRYIKHEYFDFLLKAMNIHKIYSFMNKLSKPVLWNPFQSLMSRVSDMENNTTPHEDYQNNNEIREEDWVLSPGAEQWKEITHDEYWNFIKLIIDDIEHLLKVPKQNNDDLNQLFERPTIVIVADWEPGGRYIHSDRRCFYSYDLFIKDSIKYHCDWNYHEKSAFPYENEFGDLSEHIVQSLNDRLCTSEDIDTLSQVTIIKTSVFFKHKDKLSLSYNFHDASWHSKLLLGKHKGKVYTFTQALHFRAAKLYPDIFVCQNEDGRKTLTNIYKESPGLYLRLWARYNSLEHEFFNDEEYESENYTNDNDGCGYGWSCTNCPNYGCPSNEMN